MILSKKILTLESKGQERTDSGRFTEIERENRILLEKMTSIMKYKNKLRNSQQSPLVPSQQYADLYQLSQNSQSQLPSSKRSLNKDHRKRELLKITQENQVILRRLQLSQSRYNVSKWVDEHRKNEYILRNICQFPLVIDHNPKPMTASQDGQFIQGGKMNARSISLTHYSGVNQIQDMHLRQSAQGIRQSHDRKSSMMNFPVNPIVPILNQKMAQKKPDSDFSQRQADILDQNRIVHYKKGKALFIAAFDVESPQSFLIQIPKSKASEIIDMFDKDFEKISSALKLVNNKLVLINPKYKKSSANLNENAVRQSQMRSSQEAFQATAQDAQENVNVEEQQQEMIEQQSEKTQEIKEINEIDKEGDLGIYNDDGEDQIEINPYQNLKE